MSEKDKKHRKKFAQKMIKKHTVLMWGRKKSVFTWMAPVSFIKPTLLIKQGLQRQVTAKTM